MACAAEAPENLLTAAMAAISVGVAIVDGERRIVTMNPAFYASLDLPPGSFPPGMKVEDAVRASALRGVYGPGDPEAQVAAVLAADRGRPGRLRRRTFNGRSFDLYNNPLPGGGYVACAVDVTAQIAAQEEIESRLNRATGALAALRTGIAAFTADRTLVFANLRFASLFGLPHEEMRPGVSLDHLLDLLACRDEFAAADAQDFLDFQKKLDRARPSGMRRLRANGQVLDVSSDPLPDGGWTITLTDISALARAEDEARQRARSLDSILQAIPHGICVYSPARRVSMFNASYAQIMAGAPVQVGEHVSDIIRRRAEAGEYGPGDPSEVFAAQAAFDVSRPQTRRRRRPNGAVLEVCTQPLPDGGYVSVVTDITALTEAQREVARYAEDLDVMLAHIRNGMLLWGPGARLIARNAVVGEMMNLPSKVFTPGRTQVEVLQDMLEGGVWPDQETGRAVVDGLLSLDRSRPHSRRFVTRAGRVLDVQSDPTSGGGWVSTYTDVTEARAAEETMRKAKEAAEAANQAKTRFLTTMSHELRTPLNAVIGFSDALRRESAAPSPARVAEFADQINEAGHRLLGLINTILDLARIEAGRFDFGSDRVDAARLIATAVRRVESSALASEIIVSSEIEPSLPLLRGDERRLHQILDQLLSNAVKFTEPGGAIVVSAARETDGGVVISVRDTGIGIAEEDVERAFEPFTQLDGSLARRFPGSGLGLYLCRTLVTALGGQLTLQSRIGEGTAARLRLPAGRIAHGDAADSC
jgi:signal transduction histidine kinase